MYHFDVRADRWTSQIISLGSLLFLQKLISIYSYTYFSESMPQSVLQFTVSNPSDVKHNAI